MHDVMELANRPTCTLISPLSVASFEKGFYGEVDDMADIADSAMFLLYKVSGRGR